MVVGRDNFVEDEYRGVCIDKGQMNCCVVVRLQSRVVLNRRLQRVYYQNRRRRRNAEECEVGQRVEMAGNSIQRERRVFLGHLRLICLRIHTIHVHPVVQPESQSKDHPFVIPAAPTTPSPITALLFATPRTPRRSVETPRVCCGRHEVDDDSSL